MITNFDYLKNDPKFSSFASVAISAEKIILMDPEASILNSRKAMEFAIKWMYSVDSELEMPYQDNLQSLMNAEEYRQIVGPDLWKRMDYIRRSGNNAAHSNKKLGRDEAMLCLENLFIYLDYIAYCYSDQYEEHSFDKTLITSRIKKAKESKETANAIKAELTKAQELSAKQELDLQKLIAENASLKEELSARRQEQQQTYVPKPIDLSEYKTRKLYIDSMLIDAGWTEGKDWINEVELSGMPNKSEVGFADYVLYDDMHRPLAVIEAKRTCVDVSKGRQQAKLYADLLEEKYKRRPVIFLTNGFETHIIDGKYPERKCAVIYSKRDLEKWFNLLAMRTSLKHVTVDKNIAGRYYQEAAVKSVCNSLDEKNRRKALLVMATGSGKTRTVIALCKCLLKAGWVKNILFLADRNSLVTQMIGRGTRLCPGLLDGEDKQKFYIFDFCGNFEFFRMNKGKATANMIALQGAIFNLKFEISYKLQDIEYQIDKLIEYRKNLVRQMSEKVRELQRDNFAVRQHLKYVDLYSEELNYNALTYEDTLIVRTEIAPLIAPDGDEVNAVRFDALMYGIELAYLIGKKYTRARTDLRKKVEGIANVANIPEIQAQSELINKILNTDYIDNAGIHEFEEIREKLRDLMKYIPKGTIKYVTNFDDELLSMEWNEAELENDELKNYKAKAEYYIRQHQDNIAIAKLKTNQPLTSGDIALLEEILWREVGTKQDYEHEFGSKPLGEFVREIVGLDMNAAKEAFSEYLTGANLDSRQIYFVNQIVEYIVHNGVLKDLSVLQESPFTDRGSVVEIFTDLNVWMGIRKVIDTINANAAA